MNIWIATTLSQHLKKKRCVRRTQVQTVKGKRYTGH